MFEKNQLRFARTLGLILFCFGIAAAQSEFTYQGRLTDNMAAASGTYEMQFALFDAAAGGVQIGSTITDTGVIVNNGVFFVNLDFSAAAFPGADRFLEISVRRNSSETYTVLAPRPKITSVPYAVKALNAATADDAASLGGTAANQYVLTGDARLSDARNPLPNSSSYIQNTNVQQAASNFNVSGTGTANLLNAATQFNLGGSRILIGVGDNLFTGLSAGLSNTTGTFNSFFGTSAGSANTTGSSNSFFGTSAGTSNTTGISNSFFGSEAGVSNTGGSSNSFFGIGSGLLNTNGIINSFFGREAGRANTFGDFNSFFGALAGFSNTTGNSNSFFGTTTGQSNTTGGANSFFGRNAGSSNTIGNNNTVMGYGADVGVNNLNFATAIGAGSVVSSSNTIALGRANGSDQVVIPGNMSVGGTLTASGSGLTNLNAWNLSSGTLADARLSGNVALLNTPQTFSGSKTFATASFFPARPSFTAAGSPFLVTSTTKVASLNADLLDGLNSTAFLQSVPVPLSLVGNGNWVIRAENTLSGGYGVWGAAPLHGVFGVATSSSGGGNGVNGQSQGSSGRGVYGIATHSTGNNIGVYGNSSISTAGTGVLGTAGAATGTTFGVRGQVNSPDGYAGYFTGGRNYFQNNVGIGTTSPSERLSVVGNGSFSGRVSVSSASAAAPSITFGSDPDTGIWLSGANSLNFSTGGVPRVQIGSNGNVGIGTISPSGKLHVLGDIRLTLLGGGAATHLCWNTSNQISFCSSSIRYKKNINPFSSGLDLISRLRPVTFNWKDGGMLDFGLVAEEVAEIEPLLTTYNTEGAIEGVKYDRVGVVLVNAVLEQQQMIEHQQKELSEEKERGRNQQEQIQKQQKQIDALVKLMCPQNPQAEICIEDK